MTNHGAEFMVRGYLAAAFVVIGLLVVLNQM
jgi:hypothetical protein